MKADDDSATRIAEAYRKLSGMLDDEGLDALDGLMEYLLSLNAVDRQREANNLIAYIKEIIENKRLVN